MKQMRLAPISGLTTVARSKEFFVAGTMTIATALSSARDLLVLLTVSSPVADGYFAAMLIYAVVASFGTKRVMEASIFSRLAANEATAGSSFVLAAGGMGVVAAATIGVAGPFAQVLLNSDATSNGTGDLLRVMALGLPFSYAAAAATAHAHFNENVHRPAMGDLSYNALCASTVFIWLIAETPPWIAGVGWLAGSVTNLVISIRNQGLQLSQATVLPLLRSWPLVAFPVAVGHLGLIAERVAASALGPGTLAAVSVARRLAMTLAGIASSAALSTGLARRWKSGGRDAVLPLLRSAGLLGAILMLAVSSGFALVGRTTDALLFASFAPLALSQCLFAYELQYSYSLQRRPFATASLTLATTVLVVPGAVLAVASSQPALLGPTAACAAYLGFRLACRHNKTSGSSPGAATIG